MRTKTSSFRKSKERIRIIVIGSPLGYENTVSTSIVSAVRKNGNRTTIQITAPISPGSSGSPVIDIYGRVIGC